MPQGYPSRKMYMKPRTTNRRYAGRSARYIGNGMQNPGSLSVYSSPSYTRSFGTPYRVSQAAQSFVGGGGRRLAGPNLGTRRGQFIDALSRYTALPKGRRTVTGRWQSQAMSEVEIANRIFGPGKVSDQDALDFWDPSIHQTPPPNPNSLGNFISLNSLTRLNTTTSTNVETFRVVCLQFTPSNIMGWQFSSVKPAVADTGFVPLFGSNFSDVPSDINALRMSISIKNTTINQNVGGLVRFVSLPQNLAYEYPTAILTNQFTTAFVNELFSIHDSHPNVVTANGSKAADTGLKMVSVPASMIGYNNYFTYNQRLVTDVVGIRESLDAGSGSHAMNTILMFVPNTSTAQTLEITLRASYKTRYAANSTIASLQKDFAKAKSSAWEKVLTTAIAVGQTTVSPDATGPR